MSNRRAGYYKEWYAKNREKHQAVARESYHRAMADPEKRKKHQARRTQYHKSYYAVHQETYKQRAATWYEQNKEYAKAQRRAYYQKNKEHVKLRNHGNRVKRQYGLSREQHDAMIDSQGNCCAICGRPQRPSSRNRWLCVDHDHVTNKVRGLLCDGCNFALGAFDTVELLESAQRYLEHCS